MAVEIRLPPLGQTSDEMAIIEWYKNEGDQLDIGEPLLCVETDKSNVDVESAEEGVLLKIVAQPGQVLAAGSLLAYVGESGETPAAVPPPAETTPAPAAAPPSPPSPTPTDPNVRLQASPVVRKLASDLGVDLASVVGTGPDGRIERADVERAVTGPSTSPPASTDGQPSAPREATTLTVTPVRRAIARRLTRSVQTIPAFSLQAHLDATTAKRTIEDHGNGLTYTHLLLRSVARALRAHPAMLRLWIEDGPRYAVVSEPNVGLAVAGDDSVYVVTIATPDSSDLPTLVDHVAAAVSRGRTGALTAADQAPATISVSNLGMFGVTSFVAVTDPDQNAILAAGTVSDRMVVVDGGFAVRPQLTVNLSCDHRAVDGAQAARFLQTLATYFETDPGGPAS